MKTKTIALFLLLSFSAQAGEIKLLKQEEKAPFAGYLFDYEEEQKVRLQLLEKDNMAKQISLYKENEKIYESNGLMWQKLATENTERLVKLERNTFWQNALFFGLGVVATSALAIGLSKGLK